MRSAVIYSGILADAWRVVIRGPQEQVLHQEHQAVLTAPGKKRGGGRQPLTKHAVRSK